MRIPKRLQNELFPKADCLYPADRALPSRGLMIRDPYISEILLRRKSWEIRGFSTNIRGRIGLIKSKSGHVYGEAQIVEVKGPLSFDELVITPEIGPSDMREIQETQRLPYLSSNEESKTFAWILEGAIAYKNPVPYKHPAGAVTFVDLLRAF